VNVKPSADAVAAEIARGLRELPGDESKLRDLVRGNIKARERMLIQAGRFGVARRWPAAFRR
jgi:NAD+ synthase